jgi:hypothetical protein
MTDRRRPVTWPEWRWTLLLGLIVLAATSLPYLLAWSRETPERTFSGCILLVEDCYSYLAKMRQGADGAWLFHISYTPEEHPGTLLYPFYLLLGKAASSLPGDDLTTKLLVVYHLARVVFGLGLLLATYRFLATLTRRVLIRRLAWIIVALGGGLGWLLTALGQVRWLGHVPLDLYFPEGFAFIALFGFPHVAAAQSLLLGGVSCLLRAWHPAATASLTSFKWAALTGLVWLLMGLIVPFYVPVAWAVAGAAWVTLALRQPPTLAIHWRGALLTGVAALISAPVLGYNVWVFTSHPVYGAWAAQNQILSPHPLHHLAAYGIPLVLAAFAAKRAWHSEGWAWLALSWVAAVPLLIYLPVSLQLRLMTGAQVPLSLLAAWGALRLWRSGRCCRWLTLSLLFPMTLTSVFIVVSSSAWMVSRPSPSFRSTSEVAAMDWLAAHAAPGDAALTAHRTGAYLPARASVRVLVGHDLEAMNADKMNELVSRFFNATSDDSWRYQFLTDHGVDYVFWGPAERNLGAFNPRTAPYLQQVYRVGPHIVFEVER